MKQLFVKLYLLWISKKRLLNVFFPCCLISFAVGGIAGCRQYIVLEQEPALTLSDYTLTQDSLLQGVVFIKGMLTVPVGLRLQVAPGTSVTFLRNGKLGDQASGIQVRGVLEVIGTATSRVKFQSVDEGFWGEIRIDESPGSLIRYADFHQAFWGVHIHFSYTEISHCQFLDGGGGIRFGGSGPVLITHNRFENNQTAIRYIIANPLIKNNVFIKQQVAIFVRSGSLSAQISENDFQESREFHIKLGAEQASDVAAPNNWWGTLEKPAIEQLIFDQQDDDGVGKVLFTTPALRPFSH